MHKIKPIGSAYADVTDDETALSDKTTLADFIKLSMWSFTDDADETPAPATNRILFGFETGLAVHELKPGDSTDLIPCTNLNLIYVRTLKGQPAQKIYFTTYKIIES